MIVRMSVELVLCFKMVVRDGKTKYRRDATRARANGSYKLARYSNYITSYDAIGEVNEALFMHVHTYLAFKSELVSSPSLAMHCHKT